MLQRQLDSALAPPPSMEPGPHPPVGGNLRRAPMSSKLTHTRVVSMQPQVSRRDLVGGIAVGAIAVTAAGAAQAATVGSDSTAAATGPATNSLNPSMPPALPNDQPAEVHQLASGGHPNSDDQPGDRRRRQPELAPGRYTWSDVARGFRAARKDHALRPRAHSRARRPRPRLRRARLFRGLQIACRITPGRLFQRAGERTQVFVRFSTVAGSEGSVDLPVTCAASP